MRIKIENMIFGGRLLSWGLVTRSLGYELIKLGHDVEFISTDGIKDELVPDDLRSYLKLGPTGEYDLQISYTMIKNFPHYLKHGNKNRMAIYNYDASCLSPSLVKYHMFCDYICPSSNFSASIFKKAKFPEEKIKVIPHGINIEAFKNKDKFELKTNKKIKILWDVATPHLRKNIRGTLKAWGEAFTKNDDVCLVAKVNDKYTQKTQAYVDFNSELKPFKQKYTSHADILVINDYLPSVVELYNACDIILMLSNFEQWALPCSDGLGAHKLVIASNYGGQLHYLNEKNSLLVNGNVVRMPRKYFYYEANPQGEMFEPSIEDAAEKLKYAVSNYDELLSSFEPEIQKTVAEYTWENATKKLLELAT